MKSSILWVWVLLSGYLQAVEFLYPVAMRNNGLFYLIYQKTPHHIELWEWNALTREAEQLLFSRFTPAGFRLLPTHDGFSFIDNGVLKVKKFVKRSPRIIEFDAPLYQVEIVQWIDDTLCYTSGKYQNNFGIFQVDYEGEVTPLCVKESTDCMYPQKVDNALFYIERDGQYHYQIMQTAYVPAPGEDFNERLAWHYNQLQEFTIIAGFSMPIVFLTMVSLTEGFVISHPALVSKADLLVPFDYYHIHKTATGWQTDKLFSFSIPSQLLFVGSNSRLYESLLPLLPRHYGHRIVFAHAATPPSFSLYTYDMVAQTMTPIANSHGLFPPVHTMSGGELTERVFMGVGEKGEITIELVTIPL